MKKTIFVIAFIFLPNLSIAQSSQPFSYDATLRERLENTDWVNDKNQTFAHTKAQVGMGYEYSVIKAYVQGQYSGVYGTEDNAQGLTANYFNQNNKDSDSHHVFIRQAFIDLRSETDKSNLILGRFLYSSGGETLSKNKSILWLQQKRIADRMIGAFDFTFGRSFDGVKTKISDFNLSYFMPTSGGFYTDGMRHQDDIKIFASAYNIDTNYFNEAGQVQLFYYNYQDSRNGLLKSDNRNADIIKADLNNINVNTLGFHYLQLFKAEHKTIDTIFWGATQFGDWGQQTHLAASVVSEAGVKFEDLPWNPWVRTGWNWGSGDNNKNDNKHNTFFQMLPTVRVYAQTPYFNMMNTHDLFFQTIVQPLENVNVRLDTHALLLSSREDLLYSGSGVTRENLFGYSGKSLNDDKYIGTLIDVSVGYNLNKHIALNTYYGHLIGGNALSQNDKSIDYFFLECVLKL